MEFLAVQPFIRHSDINLEKMLGGIQLTNDEVLVIDSLIGVRAAVQNELGWSCVPRFAVQRELRMGSIMELPLSNLGSGHLSLWWMRERKDLNQDAQRLQKWLGASISGDL